MRDLKGIIPDEILAKPPRIGPSIGERRIELIRVLRASPATSDRVIAKVCGVSRDLVSKIRARLVAAGGIVQPEAYKGEDGKTYHRARKAKRS